MSAKGMAALAAFCFIVIAALPLAASADAADSGRAVPDAYMSQLDPNGKAVYSAVEEAVASAMDDPGNTIEVSVDFGHMVTFESTEEAKAYAQSTVSSALAAVYYSDPMAVWLWDLPVSGVVAEVTTPSVVISSAEANIDSQVRFIADRVSFTLSVPSDLSDDPETEANELADNIRKVEEAASGVSASGTVSEKVKAIADSLVDVKDATDGEGQVSNVYDALVSRSSSSAGIAAAFTYLCQINGVEALTVRGTVHTSFDDGSSSTGYWSVVRDGDSWYGADASWYDGDDRSVLMAGYATVTTASASGERFGVTHIADLGLSSANGLAPVQIAENGVEWPDDRTFLEKYGTHVFAVVIVAVIAGTLLYAIRKGNI